MVWMVVPKVCWTCATVPEKVIKVELRAVLVT
jgi:hypothetical protein